MSRKNTNVVSKEPLQHNKPTNQFNKTYDNAPKATPEQLRIAQIYNEDDPALKGKVLEVQELTACNEEDAVMALHDCEYEVEGAINLIYEKESGVVGEQNEWQVSTKKHSKKFISSITDNIHTSGEGNPKIDHPLGVTDEMGDAEINKPPVNASRGRRRGGGNSGEPRHRRDKKERYSNTKSVNNGDIIEHGDKSNHSEDHSEPVSSQNKQNEFAPNRRGRRTDERWTSSRGRGSSRSDRGFSSHRENNSGRGSWRKNDPDRNDNARNGRGGRMVVSRRDAGMKRWQQEDDYRDNSRNNEQSDVMEIDTWNNSQANMNRPEPEGHATYELEKILENITGSILCISNYSTVKTDILKGWDDSGDLDGEWKGDSLIVTNSSAASCLDSSSKLLHDDTRERYDHHDLQSQTLKKSSDGTSSDTKSARDAYNRMATESIKNAIGLKMQDPGSRKSVVDHMKQPDSKHQNQDPYNVILGQRHSRSKPPPPSTHIPEAPIQLAPTLQSTPGSMNCQFDFGTGAFISEMKSSASVDPSNQSIINQGSNVNVLSKMDRKHQESSVMPEPPIPQRASPGDRIHRSGGLSDVISTASLDIGIQSSLVQKAPSPSTNQSAQQGQSKIYDSATSVTSHHHPSTQKSSSINSSSANAFNNNFQTSTSSTNVKVAQSQSPFSSPLKPVSISSGSATNANYDSNSQSMFSGASYQSHYSSNADNLQNESQLSKLSLSEGQQSKESSSSSNMPPASFGSHSKNISQQQQQPGLTNQMHHSNNPSNVPSSSNNTIQHMPPGIPPPMVTPHGLPFPYFPYDYETLAAQQRLMYEFQQQNLAIPSSNSELSNASSAIKSGLGSAGLQRSDVQSPPSTTSSQTNTAGHQLPQQGNLGAPPGALTMPFNLYYLAAAAANQPNQFYPQFIPSSAALGSLFHQTATQTPGQSHMNNTIPAQQYPPQPAKPLSAFNNFGSLHDDIDQMNKFSGPGGLNKSGYGGVKQQNSSGYHPNSMQQQQTHQNEMKAGNSLNSNANSSSVANNNQVVTGHMPPGNAGNSGPTNSNNVPNPGFAGFPLSNNFPNLPPHMFANNAAAGGSPPAFMTMPGVSGANPGLMHHGQDGGNNRMVNPGSSTGSKQPMKNYPFWNS